MNGAVSPLYKGLASILYVLAALARFALLVVVELIAAMLVYIYLALYSLETFGYLVRLSRGVLNVLLDPMELIFPAAATTAYATLVGELGPKSILLLLIGLLVSAGMRFGAWSFAHLKAVRTKAQT